MSTTSSNQLACGHKKGRCGGCKACNKCGVCSCRSRRVTAQAAAAVIRDQIDDGYSSDSEEFHPMDIVPSRRERRRGVVRPATSAAADPPRSTRHRVINRPPSPPPPEMMKSEHKKHSVRIAQIVFGMESPKWKKWEKFRPLKEGESVAQYLHWQKKNSLLRCTRELLTEVCAAVVGKDGAQG